MRILFIQNVSDLYGASRCLLRLASYFADKKNLVHVVLPEYGPLYDELSQKNIKISIVPDLAITNRSKIQNIQTLLKLFSDFFTSIYHLVHIINKFQPDLIHTNSATILSSGIASTITKKPHIWHVREFFDDYKYLWIFFQFFMTLFSSKIVCVSHATSRQFIPILRTKKVVVIHDGFPIDEFSNISPNRIQNFQKLYGIDPTKKSIGVIGRIKLVRKGQDLLVQAAYLLKDKYPNVQFLIIGSPFPGNETHLYKLKNLIIEFGLENQFILTGDVQDIKAAYAALSVVILPSSQPEPFGGVVIEGMAMGKPVIGTNIGGTIEQIIDNETGLLIPPNDPASLANAIENVLINPEKCQNFGMNAKKHFLNNFEFKPYIYKIEALYNATIKKY